MAKVSAGLLMYRMKDGKPEVLLAHPGGPYWKNKDEGAWTIPKGELGTDEEALHAARREFTEETGLAPHEPFIRLPSIRQKSGKTVYAWAFEGDGDTTCIKSNTFTTEWPPKSGKWMTCPEIDRAEFFDLELARIKINPAQIPFLDALVGALQR